MLRGISLPSSTCAWQDPLPLPYVYPINTHILDNSICSQTDSIKPSSHLCQLPQDVQNVWGSLTFWTPISSWVKCNLLSVVFLNNCLLKIASLATKPHSPKASLLAIVHGTYHYLIYMYVCMYLSMYYLFICLWPISFQCKLYEVRDSCLFVCWCIPSVYNQHSMSICWTNEWIACRGWFGGLLGK